MTFIGGSVPEIQDVGRRYTGWAGVARGSGTEVVGTVQRAVAALEAETNQAQVQCIDAINGMKTELVTALSALMGAQYVGKNADTARDAGSEMDQRAAQAVADMTAAFDQFRTQITALGQDLEGIATTYDQYAAGAAESGEGMGRAMEQQAVNLDEVMSNMSYG